jgi:hypothetical protein
MINFDGQNDASMLEKNIEKRFATGHFHPVASGQDDYAVAIGGSL